jgi:hypothetical protein
LRIKGIKCTKLNRDVYAKIKMGGMNVIISTQASENKNI